MPSGQVLFRPMAMMIPDYQLVAEVILFSEGFDQATWLAGKMVQLYKLASEQLSQQVGKAGCWCKVRWLLSAAGSQMLQWTYAGARPHQQPVKHTEVGIVSHGHTVFCAP